MPAALAGDDKRSPISRRGLRLSTVTISNLVAISPLVRNGNTGRFDLGANAVNRRSANAPQSAKATGVAPARQRDTDRPSF